MKYRVIMKIHHKMLNYEYLTQNGYLKESEFESFNKDFHECNVGKMKMVYIG